VCLWFSIFMPLCMLPIILEFTSPHSYLSLSDQTVKVYLLSGKAPLYSQLTVLLPSLIYLNTLSHVFLRALTTSNLCDIYEQDCLLLFLASEPLKNRYWVVSLKSNF
jgi:hypothetical protein